MVEALGCRFQAVNVSDGELQGIIEECFIRIPTLIMCAVTFCMYAHSRNRNGIYSLTLDQSGVVISTYIIHIGNNTTFLSSSLRDWEAWRDGQEPVEQGGDMYGHPVLIFETLFSSNLSSHTACCTDQCIFQLQLNSPIFIVVLAIL